MSLEMMLIIWVICDVVALFGLGIFSLLMFDSSLAEHYTRLQRVAMVVFGPITIIVAILIFLPPTRFMIWTVHEVLFKKS